jgi:hypothetical protein
MKKTIATTMRAYEKVIMFYNIKYNYDITNGTVKEQKEYNSALNIWDQLKVKYDLI